MVRYDTMRYDSIRYDRFNGTFKSDDRVNLALFYRLLVAVFLYLLILWMMYFGIEYALFLTYRLLKDCFISRKSIA